MAFETLDFSVKDAVAVITLTRPKSANTVTMKLAEELLEAAQTCRDDASIRAVVLASEGNIFSAGGDLAGFAKEGDNLPVMLGEMLTKLHKAIETFVAMDPPVIAAVNGMAAGAGLSLVAMCNLVIASEKAGFVVAYTGAGLTPDGSLTYFLPRLVGLRRAEELILTNRRLSAAEAADWGLVTSVTTEDELMPEALKLAGRLAAGPMEAFGRVRQLLLASYENDLAGQLERESESILAMSASPTGREGIAAFVEKRKPRFFQS